jgi:hypothetical protein
VHCRTCGTAGVIFVPSEVDSALELETGNLRASWYQAGYERAAAHVRLNGTDTDIEIDIAA